MLIEGVLLLKKGLIGILHTFPFSIFYRNQFEFLKLPFDCKTKKNEVFPNFNCFFSHL